MIRAEYECCEQRNLRVVRTSFVRQLQPDPAPLVSVIGAQLNGCKGDPARIP